MLWLMLILIGAIALCSWLSPPGSSLNRAAWQAFDSTVSTLSQGHEEADVVSVPDALRHMPQARVRVRAAFLRGGSASRHFRRSVLLRARSGAVPCVASY